MAKGSFFKPKKLSDIKPIINQLYMNFISADIMPPTDQRGWEKLMADAPTLDKSVAELYLKGIVNPKEKGFGHIVNIQGKEEGGQQQLNNIYNAWATCYKYVKTCISFTNQKAIDLDNKIRTIRLEIMQLTSDNMDVSNPNRRANERYIEKLEADLEVLEKVKSSTKENYGRLNEISERIWVQKPPAYDYSVW